MAGFSHIVNIIWQFSRLILYSALILSILQPDSIMETTERRSPLISLLFSMRTVNTLVRLASLGAKLTLTLYLGRYFGLAELGVYGLISAYVAVLINLLGFSIDFIVAREIVDAVPLDAAVKIRNQLAFYALNYAGFAVLLLLAYLGPLKSMGVGMILFIFFLSALEHLAAVTSANFVSLKKPVLSNLLFFIRAASWTLPAVILGILSPSFRTADTLLWLWTAGVTASLVLTFVMFRGLPWGKVREIPVDWHWVQSSVRKCFLIWLGAVGGIAATYVDRFVVEHYLGLAFVGIISFYGSFVMAITSLMHSGVFAFSYPKLVSYYRQKEEIKFRREIMYMTFQSTLLSGMMALGVGIIIPLLGGFFHRPEFITYESTLWLMLLGIWLRSASESFYYALYAKHQDRMISLGELLAVIPALGCNILLVPRLGFIGVGYSALVVALFICGWRICCMWLTFKPSAVTAK